MGVWGEHLGAVGKRVILLRQLLFERMDLVAPRVGSAGTATAPGSGIAMTR